MMVLVLFLLALISVLPLVLGDGLSKSHEFAPFYNNTNPEARRRLSVDVYRAIHHHLTSQRFHDVLSNHTNYKNRLPFPHMVADNLFPIEVLNMVANEIPDNPELLSEGCAIGNQKCFKTKTEKFKNAFDNEEKHGPATSALFGYLKSSTFIHFLEKLTGINGLIPDPHYRGSGIHQTLPGGYLNIHADFNRYKAYDLHRRVNILLYLNPNWEDSYGGHLELWSKDMQSCMVRATPDIGRITVFSSTDFSYHGHPNPLTCPKERSRRSLALYYYTRTRPSSECVYGNCYSAHTTLFQKAPCRCEDKKCLKLVNQK